MIQAQDTVLLRIGTITPGNQSVVTAIGTATLRKQSTERQGNPSSHRVGRKHRWCRRPRPTRYWGQTCEFLIGGGSWRLELGVDVPISTPLRSSSGSPRCIPMLLVLNASLPLLTVRVDATAPQLFFMSRAGFPFNTLIFPGESSSACKRSSVPSSMDSPQRTATGTY